jgi:hypothetical protein
MDKPYKIYTEAGAGAPVVTLAAGERILSVTVEPDGTNVVTVVVVTANLARNDTVSAKGPWGTDWDGALTGPGTVTFGNLGAGHYVVTTEQQ